MCKLTLEIKGYNRSVFYFDNFDEMCEFLKKALEHSADEDIKATIAFVKVGEADEV